MTDKKKSEGSAELEQALSIIGAQPIPAATSGDAPADLQDAAQLAWDAAIGDAALYVASHCHDGDRHAQAIMHLRMPQVARIERAAAPAPTVKGRTASEWYVTYCEVSEKLKAAEGCIDRYTRELEQARTAAPATASGDDLPKQWHERIEGEMNGETTFEAMKAEINELRAIARAAVSAATKPTACTIPPAGWYCTRAPGHEGPCAALPSDNEDGYTAEQEAIYQRGIEDGKAVERGMARYNAGIAARDAATKPTADPESIEQYRVQMAAISSAALGYWKESEGIKPEYDTVPLRDVAKLYAKYEALLATKPAAQTVPTDYVLMPKRLTAENGAKSLFLGEFKETLRLGCPDCDPDGESCETCGDAGEIEHNVTIGWDTIKRIYALAVEKLAAAPAATPAAQDQAERAVLAIPAAIMNIKCDMNKCALGGAAAEMSYKLGHRDARHAAADLVLERADELKALAAPAASADAVVDARNQALEEAITECNLVMLGVDTPEESVGVLNCRDAIIRLKSSGVLRTGEGADK